MQTQVNIHEAKTRLSQFIERVEADDEVVIACAGLPVARLIPIAAKPQRRVLGPLTGQVPSPAQWNGPLPAELLDAFEGP